jgi:predicted DsbA family dithiol-disulfide isomerase
MRVDIWSDVVCPWCYVGKARLEKALASHPRGAEAEVVYHAYELDPSYPADQHETNLQLLSRKYGMAPEQARQADGQVAALARAEGRRGQRGVLRPGPAGLRPGRAHRGRGRGRA